MTENIVREDTSAFQSAQNIEFISQLANRSLKPGTTISFALPEGRVNITLDGSGDWTIMVGLASRSGRIVPAAFSLEKLGFFRAAETDGSVYFLWTSALENGFSERSLVEELLFETLRALQRNVATQYIC